MQSEQIAKWPDLTVDQTAWEMAKLTAPEGATISDLAQRAQRIKTNLLTPGETDFDQATR